MKQLHNILLKEFTIAIQTHYNIFYGFGKSNRLLTFK